MSYSYYRFLRVDWEGYLGIGLSYRFKQFSISGVLGLENRGMSYYHGSEPDPKYTDYYSKKGFYGSLGLQYRLSLKK